LLKASIAGKLRNTNLPKNQYLLPVFEAVSNSFQAIDDAPSSPDHEIRIRVERDKGFKPSPSEAPNGFVVTDTGIGFDEDNLNSFKISESMYKHSRGGKGVGRFLWLKAFERADIDSVFLDRNGQYKRRVFRFDESFSEADKHEPEPTSETKLRTSVSLVDYLETYKGECPRDLKLIAQRFIGHFLAMFLVPEGPKLIIEDDFETINLRQYFKENVEQPAKVHSFKAGEHAFSLRGFRLQSGYQSDHELIFAADGRRVVGERLETRIPNLRNKLHDDVRGHFTYLALVEGEYLSSHVNSQRTAFSFPAKAAPSTDLLAGEVDLATIRDEALKVVRNDLAPYLDELNAGKTARVESYIQAEAPEYRPLLSEIPRLVEELPPNPSNADLDTALHRKLYERRVELRAQGKAILAQVVDAEDVEEYDAQLRRYIEKENEVGKSTLAKYIQHRRVILDLLDKSVSRADDGKYPLERAVHRLVFPMRTFSDDVPPEQQNLWVIDERLSFHAFLSSDQPLAKIPILDTTSESRPDILIFNRPILFGEGSEPLTSMIVVEFKRADRNDYKDESPLQQAFRLVRQVRDGVKKDFKGRPILPASKDIPAYCYVICDITPRFVRDLEDMSAVATPDNMGYYGYNRTLTAYYEVISYNKLLSDANKRNRVLFQKLNLPTT
jgi:hypothetical protein